MQIPDEVYQTVLRSMPIPCVDLIVFNSAREILLVRRTNEPARGQWWFPGGRVHFEESREVAVMRVLMQECGLRAGRVEELSTLDVILPLESAGRVSHAIATFYLVTVDSPCKITLDDQASDFAWKKPALWEKEPLNAFVRDALRRAVEHLTEHENAG